MGKALHHNIGEITIWRYESRKNVRMIYGQKPKYHKTIPAHASKYPNVFRRPYGTWVEGKGSSTRSMPGFGLENKGGNPEYPNQQS